MKKQGHPYLINLYTKVNEYLADYSNNDDNLADIIVSFCIVVEKTLKIKLHEKNPVLVFDVLKLKDNDSLTSVVTKKENSIDTIRIVDVIERFKILYQNVFSEEELQALLDIYFVRNNLIHGYKTDDIVIADSENLIKKMGTIWEKFTEQATVIFGKENIKVNNPKRKYSEEELESVLIEEVKKKIESQENYNYFGILNRFAGETLSVENEFSPSAMLFDLEKCPRCGSNSLSLDNGRNYINGTVFARNPLLKPYTNLYKCKICSLELTKKEYDIAKKIKNKDNL